MPNWSDRRRAACDGAGPRPMLAGMRQPSLPTPLTRPIGQSGGAAVIAGAAMGAIAGARVACHLRGALLALVALPLLGQGTRRGEHAANRPAPTTTTAARLVWLAIAAALGRCPRRTVDQSPALACRLCDRSIHAVRSAHSACRWDAIVV